MKSDSLMDAFDGKSTKRSLKGCDSSVRPFKSWEDKNVRQKVPCDQPDDKRRVGFLHRRSDLVDRGHKNRRTVDDQRRHLRSETSFNPSYRKFSYR